MWSRSTQVRERLTSGWMKNNENEVVHGIDVVDVVFSWAGKVGLEPLIAFPVAGMASDVFLFLYIDICGGSPNIR